MRRSLVLLFIFAIHTSSTVYAQGTAADYERASGLKAKYEAAAIDIAGQTSWIGNTHRLWYRKLSRGVSVYMIFDADTMQKTTAFDHEKIAASLSKLTNNTFKSNDLSLTQLRFEQSPEWASTAVQRGGQNSLGGLLFHPEFYKAAISYAGCHDNRMDKIWWNEQWMGWPIGPQYSASSNVDNAYRLQGDLLLVVGEMDTNVDPSSTMQVVHQLLKHNKDFDLLVIPGANHAAGRGDRYAAYGDHKRYDFFVRHLLGANPPHWNQPVASTSQSSR